jgi:sec-independent protein translocase protein TatC
MAKTSRDYDPDSYRMTIGEHLEELRTRLIFGLAGFILAAIVCFIFGEHVVHAFVRPLAYALAKNKLNPQLYTTDVADVFMVYVKMSLITAAAFSAPWMLYQLWQFVAAGLYPKERKYITRYLPLSIFLLIAGMVFLYYIVLPLMLEFFLAFSIGGALEFSPPKVEAPSSTQPVMVVPTYQGDPAHPMDNQIWIDSAQKRLKMFFEGEIRVIPFGSSQMTAPLITLPGYISMVVQMLLSFGLAFQMPLAVLALVRVGIVSIDQMRKARGVVYFTITVLSAMIVPDVAAGMIALMIPLFALFELGLILARIQPKALD